MRGLGDRRIAERVDDLLDLERRVLLALDGREDRGPDLPLGAILLADELLPSQFMGLDASKLAGFCMAGGGPTSHVAILAGSLDDTSGLTARCHIFTADKGCFYWIDDGLPQFLRDGPDLPVDPA